MRVLIPQTSLIDRSAICYAGVKSGDGAALLLVFCKAADINQTFI